MLVSKLATLGIKSFYNWGSGSLIISVGYFIQKREWSKRNGPIGLLDQRDPQLRKVLLRTWENDFDWTSVTLCILFAGYELAIVCIMILTMQFSH